MSRVLTSVRLSEEIVTLFDCNLLVEVTVAILAYFSDSCCVKRLYPHKERILITQAYEGEVWLLKVGKILY